MSHTQEWTSNSVSPATPSPFFSTLLSRYAIYFQKSERVGKMWSVHHAVTSTVFGGCQKACPTLHKATELARPNPGRNKFLILHKEGSWEGRNKRKCPEVCHRQHLTPQKVPQPWVNPAVLGLHFPQILASTAGSGDFQEFQSKNFEDVMCHQVSSGVC